MKSFSYFLSIGIAACTCLACNQKKAADTAPAQDINPKLVAEGPYETYVDSTLTSPAYVLINKEQVNVDEYAKDQDGFITLFDGNTFAGWRGYDKDTIPARWTIEDGAIKINGSGQGEAHSKNGGDIIFAHKFRNFELSFEWKVASGSNSGVLYLAREIKGEPIWISAPEYQVLDNIGHPDAQLGENGNRQSASLYDMIPANPQNAQAVGQWNQGGILVFKGTVIHKQNGKNVLEYHLWTNKWNDLVAASKFKQGGDFPLAYDLLINLGGPDREGYIGLQDHGDDVWYRNIKIKILD
ncbi:MAG: DUF1080 domain-containing protein [Dysgonamonadaceae bacterium]|jgi:hypothetical protein|nr:DUF1080 domain-containing protein [Dysgonamonadaceae bacterium]